MPDLLLDTCALLWLAEGMDLAGEARRAVVDGRLNVSPITAWEIAELVRNKKVFLTMPATQWFRQATELMEAAQPELSATILADACELPGMPPDDPADRIIIATARQAGMVLMTRDKNILAYSREGHVQTMAC